MGLLNRIVNGLVLGLAIVSVVFGYLLFQKRDQLVKRGDLMAQAINSVSSKLDSGSGTKCADNLQFLKLELDPNKDPKALENAQKTLYHTNYQNLQAILEPFKKQALNVIEQRDILGVTLNDVAVKLEIPETFTPAQFHDLSMYKEKKEALISNVVKVNARDNAIAEQIAASAGVIGFTLDKETLKNLDSFKTPLDEFASKVEALKKRSDKYADHINRICSILQIQAPSLSGDSYAQELSTVETSAQAIKDEFEKTKVELAKTKEDLEKKTEDLNKAVAKIEVYEKKIIQLTKDLAKERGEIGDDPTKPAPEQESNLFEKLEGKIIELNPKWDFVVIDLGKNNKITVGAKKKREEIVPLPEGKVMFVGREDQYLGKIKVIRVNDNCAIANIMPEDMGGKIKVGDKVFFGKKAATAVTAVPAGAVPAMPAAPAAAPDAVPEAVAPAVE